MRRAWIALVVWSAWASCGVLAGCGGWKEDLQFKDFKNIKFGEKDSNMSLTGDVVLYNPNNASLTLREADLKAFMNEKEVAAINQKMNVKVKARSEFTLPVEISLANADGLMGTLLNILGQKSNTLKFVGFLKIKVHGVGMKIPISHTEKLN
ncbi:MAG: hypothetical protein CRN43_18170 [Candidatus Nephrothrix sp. EaCA]|nr:MAG: hypothetical protein CRN43_18170 [Candidatus Nephrothrix sp. EaCA]